MLLSDALYSALCPNYLDGIFTLDTNYSKSVLVRFILPFQMPTLTQHAHCRVYARDHEQNLHFTYDICIQCTAVYNIT